MHAAIKRTIIAGAALAAAALFGSVPYQGPQAMRGAPTVHRDVALVDNTVVGAQEINADNYLWDTNLGTNGAEEQLYGDLGGNTASSAPLAQALLDTDGANPVWSGDFNGADSRFIEGLFVSEIYSQDEANQLLGLETVGGADQAAFANDILNTNFVPFPSSLEPGFTLTPGADFDSELLTLAEAEFTSAGTDFEGYLADLPTNLEGLSGLSSSLGDVSTLLSELTGGLF